MFIIRSQLSFQPYKEKLPNLLFLYELIAVIHYTSKQIQLKNNHIFLIIHLNTKN